MVPNSLVLRHQCSQMEVGESDQVHQAMFFGNCLVSSLASLLHFVSKPTGGSSVSVFCWNFMIPLCCKWATTPTLLVQLPPLCEHSSAEDIECEHWVVHRQVHQCEYGSNFTRSCAQHGVCVRPAMRARWDGAPPCNSSSLPSRTPAPQQAQHVDVNSRPRRRLRRALLL